MRTTRVSVTDPYSLIVARSAVSEARSDRSASFNDVAMLDESGRQSLLLYNGLRFTNHRYARVQSAHSR
jgi:hypothetical protein